jgi:RNA polymerase sigma factor (sigma-70 family)
MPLTLNSQTDTELIAQFKLGKHEVLGILYTRYTALVYGTALKYLKDRDDAKDAVMQVFEKLNTLLHHHDVTHFKSWLYVTVRNHCLMQLRAHKGRETVRLGEGHENSETFMELPAAMHLPSEPDVEYNLIKLEKCINELGVDQQRCVRLFYLQEKCYQQVATETGYNMNQVKSYIQNGKRNLKLCMERNG